MLRNHFKIALRNLMRNPIYTFINVAGLSIGIATSLMIILWVVDEVTYNRFHANVDHLYHVRTNGTVEDNKISTWAGATSIVYDELKNWNQFKYAAISSGDEVPYLLTAGEKQFNQQGRFVSPEFLKMFQFPLLKGSREQVLNDPHSIVLTEPAARALFGDADPINKSIIVNNGVSVTVTGILKELPSNSSFQFDFLMPFTLYEMITPWVKEVMDNVDSDQFEIYAELKPEADVDVVNREIKDIIKKHTTWMNKELFLYPMSRWHLHAEFENGKESTNDREDYVIGLSIIAAGVLIIACINFMNLSTARSQRRAREVGVRKIAGAKRKELIIQFLRESIFITAVSFLIAIMLAQLLLPLYNSIVQKKLFIHYSSPLFWLCAVGLILFTGLIAGSYPAFFLSSFKPAKVLKGTMLVGNESSLPRKILVIAQFGFSIFLIIGTVVIYQQMQFVKDRQLGYQKENLITIRNNEGLKKSYHAIKNELTQNGLIYSCTKSNSPINQIYEANFLEFPPGHDININNIFAEYDYVKTMGIKLIEGRDFSEGIASDTAAVILNKVTIDLMGLKNPIGARTKVAGTDLEIIGVTENIVMDSPFHPVEPMYIVLETKWESQYTPQNITVRLPQTDDLNATLKKVEKVFKKYNSQYPFEYSFVDDDFNKRFKSINLIGRLTNIFAFIAIFIAGLGLFGLAAFTAERRTKEFGVRKILGATVFNLVALISRDFVKMVLVSFFISAPLAWWMLTGFLEQYPYHISINWLILPVTCLVMLVTTLAIVATQVIKVALTNPVDSLGSE